MSAGAFKAHFFQDNVDRVQCVWRPRRREGDPRKHIAKMLNEVICHCCNEPRTDGPGEREFPGKIGDDGDGPLVLLSFMCLLRLRSDYAPSASGLQGSMTEDHVSLLDHAQHCRAMPCSPNCRTCPRQLGGVPLVCLAPPRRGAFTIWRRGQLIIGWTPSVDFDSDSERKGTEDRQKSFRSPHSLTHGLFLMHSIWP